MKKEKIMNVPNTITFLRVILLIFMWIFAITKDTNIVAILLLIAFFTDTLDGTLARLLKQETRFGARFDSAIDNLVGISIIIWIPILLPILFSKYMIPLAVMLFFLGSTWLLGFIKFKRNPELHLYSNKIMMVFGGLGVVYILLFGDNPILIYLMIIFTILMAIEEITIIITHKKINEDIRTIFQKKK